MKELTLHENIKKLLEKSPNIEEDGYRLGIELTVDKLLGKLSQSQINKLNIFKFNWAFYEKEIHDAGISIEMLNDLVKQQKENE